MARQTKKEPRPRHGRGKGVTGGPPEKITIGEFLFQVKLSHIYGALIAIIAVLSGTFVLGFNLQSAISEGKISKAAADLAKCQANIELEKMGQIPNYYRGLEIGNRIHEFRDKLSKLNESLARASSNPTLLGERIKTGVEFAQFIESLIKLASDKNKKNAPPIHIFIESDLSPINYYFGAGYNGIILGLSKDWHTDLTMRASHECIYEKN